MSRPAAVQHADSPTWAQHRTRVEKHFQEGAGRWTHLTGHGPVSWIRSTVRAGRREMRGTLMDWLPEDLSGARVLDAGCGPGVMALELAARGARVVGVDLSADLISVARERAASAALGPDAETPDFRVGDFLEVASEGFDYLVSMDCLIHYPLRETLASLRAVEDHVSRGMLVTVAPWTPLLSLMHGLGKVFPRGDRAPGIVPVRDGALRRGLSGPFGVHGFALHRTRTIHSGFYISRALELTRRGGALA